MRCQMLGCRGNRDFLDGTELGRRFGFYHFPSCFSAMAHTDERCSATVIDKCVPMEVICNPRNHSFGTLYWCAWKRLPISSKENIRFVEENAEDYQRRVLKPTSLAFRHLHPQAFRRLSRENREALHVFQNTKAEVAGLRIFSCPPMLGSRKFGPLGNCALVLGLNGNLR